MVRFLLSFFKFWFTYTTIGTILFALLVVLVPKKTSGLIIILLGATGYLLVIAIASLMSFIAAYRQSKRDKHFDPETYENERQNNIR